MPQKDKQTNPRGIMGNPLVKRIIYQLPHGKEAYQAAEFVAGQADKHPEVVTKVRATARHILDDLRHRQRSHPKTTFVLGGLEDRLLGVDGTPRLGELVVMNDQANGYGCTKEGSYGILKKVVGNEATVEFHYVTGKPHPLPASLAVDKRCVKKAALEDELKQTQDIGFKVGDKVKISEASKYFGQHEGEAKIIGTDPFNEELPYIVQFADGYQNNYSREDLDAVKRIKTPKTEVKFGAKDKKHDATCIHTSLLGKVGHYFGRVTLDHLVAAVVTAAMVYVGQCTMENFKERQQSRNMPYAASINQTAISDKTDLVIGETILVLGNNKYEQTADKILLDPETMKRMLKIY